MDLGSLRQQTRLLERTHTFEQYKLPYKELECVTTENGRHYISPNGKKLTSVTTMLGRSSDHGWLDEWRERLGAAAADAETQRCADRGEAVHLACELYLGNAPMEKVRAAAGNYFFMYKQLHPHLNKVTKVYAQEIPLYSETLGLAGRVDFVGVYNGKACILDFKTSNLNKTRGMIEDYSIQLCLYSFMFEEMFGKRIDTLINVISNERSPVATVIEFNRNDVAEKAIERVKLYRKMDAERGGDWVNAA
ncbi:exonuclease [Erwinia phage vB_EamM-Bue1]|uniref:PD-(D/E)XK endonuclease-like domain-containing protein n=1 Tax=Erwinia phage vB_EamM-Bue1 TaxID=2099338 RepID=A0A2P1JUD2_9CAUD|nr:exonuclease [Erwinia phage vB_EamM-Bue1]AVO22952.1 hypothetical protein [Erwinia phage vB_EamM-Bue1]